MFMNNLFLSSDEATESIIGTTIQGSDTAANDGFGFSMGVSRDGNYMVVGASTNDATQTDQGSAYVFLWNGSVWSQQAQVVASDPGASDNFGTSIAINSAGDTMAIGSIFDDGTLTDQGSVYVFTRSGTSWSQQAKLVPSDPATNGWFGRSVALSDDGNTLIIGSDAGVGAAYVFTRSGTSWSQQAKLTPSDSPAGARFGVSVDISQTGNTAVVGAFLANKAYTYTRSGSVWTEQHILTTSSGNQSGQSVAISGDGSRCIIGSPGNKKAFVFDSGVEVAVLTGVGFPEDGFGTSVDMSTNGGYVLVGSPTGGNMRFYSSVTPSSWISQYFVGSSSSNLGNRVAMSGLGTQLVAGHNSYTGGGRVVTYTRTVI